MVDIKREKQKRKPAKKGASKKKKRASKKKMSATSVQRLLASDAWPRKEEVPGYDPSAWDIPGHFEGAAYHLKIWPFYRGADAKPFECLRGQPENAPIYYDGGRKVNTGWHNAYYSVC